MYLPNDVASTAQNSVLSENSLFWIANFGL